jgi:REP element-mobilizing transposase RayT
MLLCAKSGSADDLVVGAFCMNWTRRLPHWVPENSIVFVTWTLEGKAKGRSCRWLADPRIAQIVEEALLYGASQGKYDLHAWVIMPDHGHMVIEPKAPIQRIMQWLKSATAHRANAVLDRAGEPFWMREYYDRWMRSDAEISKTIAYLEDNPVRAGLAASAEEYRWSSARVDDNIVGRDPTWYRGNNT